MNLPTPDIRDSLAAAVRILEQVHGLDVSPYDESFLLKSIDKRLAETGIGTVAAYGEYLAVHRAEAELFYSSLRVIYSEFFRNPLAFALLEQVILPGLVAVKKRSGQGGVRVWSAGCAAGQEVWSVAMLLDELTGAESRTLSYRIFASDMSETDLDYARAGLYTADELKDVRLRHLDACFSRQGDVYSLVPRIRSQVQFAPYDLLETGTTCPPASIYGEFDLVLCSNVLLYYRPEAQIRILNKLRESLAPGGYLITGETEQQIIINRVGGFRAVTTSAAVFQKKNIYHTEAEFDSGEVI